MLGKQGIRRKRKKQKGHKKGRRATRQKVNKAARVIGRK
jgi:hypothetical protein